MKKFILIAVLIAFNCIFIAGCDNGGSVTVTTGDTTATSENESTSTVEQSQIDEIADLLPSLICTECDLAQIDSAGRMYDILTALVTGQEFLPDGQQVDTALTQPQITIAIDAYSSAINTMTKGEDTHTQTIESDFNDQIEDLLDDSGSQTQTPGEVVT